MSVTAPAGFRSSGVVAGLKTSGKPDLMVLVNDGPLKSAAAVFTTNRFAAAPVQWTRGVVKRAEVHALLINSGGANACTGEDGLRDTRECALHLGELLGVAPEAVAICSTGMIGVRLPMQKMKSGIEAAVRALSPDGGLASATAIMTTDTVPKIATTKRGDITFGGIAKGAGMLAPELATMLVAITTDANVDSHRLDLALREAVRLSFDRVDSDGCQSTNDTVIALASGMSGEIADEELVGALTEVCVSLARQLIADAEGASKEVAITVINALSESDALDVARACARSNLLKCALHGGDPNWGRILSAAGTSSAHFEPTDVDVSLNGVMIARNGAIGDDRDAVDMTGRQIDITIDLKAGHSRATIWTNDLTAAYVHENSAYST